MVQARRSEYLQRHQFIRKPQRFITLLKIRPPGVVQRGEGMIKPMIQPRDIEQIEDQLHSMVDMVEELDARRAEWLENITQNASEQLDEFGKHPEGFDAMLEEFENFEGLIDDTCNHIKHALDIVADQLPQYQRRLASRQEGVKI